MTEQTFVPIHQPKPDPDPIILRNFEVELQNLKLLHGDKHISIAILLTSIGEYYYSLERYGDAKIQFELSLNLFEEILDPSSEYVIDANYRLSKVLNLLPSDSHADGGIYEKNQITKTRKLREQYDSTINSSSLAEDSIISTESMNYNNASYEGRKENHKSNSIDSTLVYNDLAEEARISGNYEEASRLYEKAIMLRKRKYGDDSPAVAPVLINLGDMLRIQGKYEEAQGYLEEALGINMQAYGSDHDTVADALNTLGQLFKQMGSEEDFIEAENLFIEALRIRRIIFGDYNETVGSTLNNIAELLREKGDYIHAISYHNTAIESFAKSVGSFHPGTMNAKGNLGVTLRRQARVGLEEGEALLRDAVDYLKDNKFDNKHPWLVKFGTEQTISQAQKLVDEGKHELAVELFETIVKKKDNVQPGQVSTTISSEMISSSQDMMQMTVGRGKAMLGKAKLFMKRGQYNEVEVILQNCSFSCSSLLGFNHPIMIGVQLTRAENKMLNGEYEQANEFFSEVLQTQVDLHGPDHVDVVETMAGLGEWYCHQALFIESETLLIQAMQIVSLALKREPAAMEKSSSSYTPLYARILILMVDLYLQKGSYNLAKSALQQAITVCRRSIGENDSIYTACLTVQARLLVLQGDYQTANVTYDQILNNRQRFLEKEHPLVASTLLEISSLNLLQGNLSQAKKNAEIARSIGKQFFPHNDNHPILSTCNYILGKIIFEYGYIKESLFLIETSLNSRKEIFGEYHPFTSQCKQFIALINLTIGKSWDTIPVFLDEITELQKESFGTSSHPDIYRTRHIKALLLQATGKYSECVAIFELNIKEHESLLGSIGVDLKLSNLVIIEYKLALCHIYRILGRYKESAILIGNAGASLCKVLGEDNLRVGNCFYALAELCVSRGDYKDAKILFSRCLVIYCRIFSDYANNNDTIEGDNNNNVNTDISCEYHYLVAQIHLSSANNLRGPGYFEDALQAFDKAYQLYSNIYGEDNIITVLSLSTKFKIKLDQNLADEIEPLLQKILVAIRKQLGDQNGIYLNFLVILGECMRLQVKFAVSEGIFNQGINSAKELLGERHPILVDISMNQAILSADQGAISEALRILQKEVMPLAERLFEARHPIIIYLKGQIGRFKEDLKPTTGKLIVNEALKILDTSKFPFSSNHPWIIALGGYNNLISTKRLSSTVEVLSIADWATPKFHGDPDFGVTEDHKVNISNESKEPSEWGNIEHFEVKKQCKSEIMRMNLSKKQSPIQNTDDLSLEEQEKLERDNWEKEEKQRRIDEAKLIASLEAIKERERIEEEERLEKERIEEENRVKRRAEEEIRRKKEEEELQETVKNKEKARIELEAAELLRSEKENEYQAIQLHNSKILEEQEKKKAEIEAKLQLAEERLLTLQKEAEERERIFMEESKKRAILEAQEQEKKLEEARLRKAEEEERLITEELDRAKRLEAEGVLVATSSGTNDGSVRGKALEASVFLLERAIDLQKNGGYMKARPLFEEVLVVCDKYYTKDEQPYLDAMSATSDNYRYLYMFEESNDRYKTLLSATTQAHGKDSLQVAQVTYQIGLNRMDMGLFVESDITVTRSLDMLVPILSNVDSIIGVILLTSALLRARLGKLSEAKAQSDRGFSILQKAYGVRKVEFAEAFASKAKIFLTFGKPKDAKLLLEQALSMRRRFLGETHYLIAQSMLDICLCIFDLGKYREAYGKVNAILDMTKEYFPENSLRYAEVLYHQACMMHVLSIFSESIRIHRVVIEIRETNLINHFLLSESYSSLSKSLIIMAKYNEAYDYIKKSSLIRNNILGTKVINNEYIAENLCLEGLYHYTKGNYPEAKILYDKAYEMRFILYTKDHPRCLENQILIINTLIKLGDIKDAIRLYKRAVKLCEELGLSEGEDHPIYANILFINVEILTAQGSERRNKEMDAIVFKERKKKNLFAVNDTVKKKKVKKEEGDDEEEVLSSDITKLKDAMLLLQDCYQIRKLIFEEENSKIPVSAMELIECINNRGMLLIHLIEANKEVEELESSSEEEDSEYEEEDEDAIVVKKVESKSDIKAPKLVAPAVEFTKTAEGIPIFNNYLFQEPMALFTQALAMFRSINTTFEEIEHPLILNILGNIGIVEKLQNDAREFFISSLNQNDRKLIRIEDRRIVKANYYDQKLNKEEDLEEDIEDIVNQLCKIKPGNKAIGHALVSLERYNYLPEHPWICKFNRYFNSQVEAPSDLELAKRLYNSGLNSMIVGNYSESLDFFDQAIVSQVELLGAVTSSFNMDVANSFFEKAQVLRIGSNFLESLNFYLLFTAITHKYHNGQKNLFTTKGNYGVAEILRMQGVHEDAKAIYERVHTTRIELFGENNVYTAQAKRGLAEILLELGSLDDAKTHANNSLTILYSIYKDTPDEDIAESHEVLAKILLSQALFEEAIVHIENSIKMRILLHGEDHPDVAQAYQLKSIYNYELGKFSDSRRNAGITLRIRIKFFGKPLIPKNRVKKLPTETYKAFIEILENVLKEEIVVDDLSRRLEYIRKPPEPVVEEKEIGDDNTVHTDEGKEEKDEKDELNFDDNEEESDDEDMENNENVEVEEQLPNFVYRGKPVASHPLISETLSLLADINLMMGNYSEAKELFNVTTVMQEEIYGDESIKVGRAKLSVAKMLLKNGQLSEAGVLFKNSLEMTMRLMGEMHPYRADALVAIAELRYFQCQSVDCENFYQQALTIRQSIYGHHHPKIAEIHVGFGNLTCMKGNYADANELFILSLNILRPVFGDIGVPLAAALYGQGQSARDTGNYDLSYSLIDQSLSIRSSLMGEDHPEVYSCMHLLGEILRKQSKNIEAKKMFEHCIKVRLTKLGKNHLDTLSSLVNLAMCYTDIAKFSIARTMFERAMKLIKLVTGDSDHFLVSQCQLGLAENLKNEAKYTDALLLLRHSLAMRQRLYGDNHVSIAESLYNIAELMKITGNYEESIKIHDNALAMRRNIMTFDSSIVARSMYGLADSLFVNGRINEAKILLDRGIQMQRVVFSNEHPDLVDSQCLLAMINKSDGRMEQALALFERCLEQQRNAKGPIHPMVAKILYLMADTSNLIGNYKQAHDWFLDSLSLRRAIYHADDPDHPELAESYWGIAENLRLRGKYDRVEIEEIEVEGSEAEFDENASFTIGDDTVYNQSLVSDGTTRGVTGRDYDSVQSKINKKNTKKEKKIKGLSEYKQDMDDDQDFLEAVIREPQVNNKSEEIIMSDVINTDFDQAIINDSEFPLAMPLYLQVYDMYLVYFEKEHPLCISIQYCIAEVMKCQGRYNESLELFQIIYGMRKKILGDDHISTIESMCGLADMLRTLSKIYPSKSANPIDRKIGGISRRSDGPSLEEYLSSIMGYVVPNDKPWTPSATVHLAHLVSGKELGKPAPLSSLGVTPKPKPKLQGYKSAYDIGFQGYGFPKQKDITRATNVVGVTRPALYFTDDAKWLYDTGLNLMKKLNNEDHPLIALLLFGKSELMRARRKPEKAHELLESALVISRKIYRSNHPFIATCLNSLAEILRTGNSFDKAGPLYEKALFIYSKVYNNCNHPSITDVQNNNAMLLYAQGHYPQAQLIFETSLKSRTELLGSFHPAVAQSLNNLAGLLHTTGDFDGALPKYLKALEVKQFIYGPKHPDVASTMNNLGLLYKSQMRFDESLASYEVALQIQKDAFGQDSDHPDIASSLSNLAALAAVQLNYSRAQELYRQSLEMKRKIFGLCHHVVAAALNNYAGVLYHLNNLEDSKDLYEESLKIRRKIFGEDHPDVAESLNNIALIFFKQENYREAQPLYERALAIKISVYGKEHLQIASCMNNLAGVLHKLNLFNQAYEFYDKAFKIRVSILGRLHPDSCLIDENMQACVVDKQNYVAFNTKRED